MKLAVKVENNELKIQVVKKPINISIARGGGSGGEGGEGDVAYNDTAVRRLIAQNTTSIQTTATATSAEVTAREAANTALTLRIDNLPESISEEDVDSKILQETNSRISADDTEREARESTYTSLGGEIAAEQATRATDDRTLSDRITTDKGLSTGADTALGVRIDNAETTNAATHLDIRTEIANIALPDAPDTGLTEGQVQVLIDVEVGVRSSADTALGQRINAETGNRTTAIEAEATARLSTDDNLTTQLGTESASRQSGDSALRVRIDALQNPVSESDIDAKVAVEAAIREAADTALESRISALPASVLEDDIDAKVAAEATLRVAGDTALGTRITDAATLNAQTHVAIRTEIANIALPDAPDTGLTEGQVQALVDVEMASRSAADIALGQRIDSTVNLITTETGDRTTAVQAEATARAAEDTALSDTLTQEIATRTSQIAVVIRDINNEVESRSTDVEGEATARTAADTALGTRIDNISGGVPESDIDTKIAVETTARTAEDTALGLRITAEQTVRLQEAQILEDVIVHNKGLGDAADTALGTRITDAATANATTHQNLQNSIDDNVASDNDLSDELEALDGEISLSGLFDITTLTVGTTSTQTEGSAAVRKGFVNFRGGLTLDPLNPTFNLEAGSFSIDNTNIIAIYSQTGGNESFIEIINEKLSVTDTITVDGTVHHMNYFGFVASEIVRNLQVHRYSVNAEFDFNINPTSTIKIKKIDETFLQWGVQKVNLGANVTIVDAGIGDGATVEQVDAKVAVEATARTAADADLGLRITAEETGRLQESQILEDVIVHNKGLGDAADTALGTRITDAATANATTHGSLQATIDSLTSTGLNETQARALIKDFAEEGNTTDKVPRNIIFDATAPSSSSSITPTSVVSDDTKSFASTDNTQPKGLVLLDGKLIVASQTVDGRLYAYDEATQARSSADDWTTVGNADDKTGMCLTPDYLHAANYSDGRIYTWNRTTKGQVTSKTIICNTLNNRPIGIYSPDGERILCSQNRSRVFYTYNVDDGTEDTTNPYTFTLNVALTQIDAMWGTGDYIWFAGVNVPTAYCHSISTGLEITEGNFALHANNRAITGMTGGDDFIRISDRSDQRIYGYALTIGSTTVTTVDALAGSVLLGTPEQIDTGTSGTLVVAAKELTRKLREKQDSLTAGANITIAVDNTISTPTIPTADIEANTLKRSYPTTEQDQVEQNKLNALVESNRRFTDDHALGVRVDGKQDNLTAGSNITIASDNTISTPTIPTDAIAVNTLKRSYPTTEQDQVEQNKLKILVEAGLRFTGDDALGTRIDGKQDALTAGSNITIASDNTISTPTIPTDAIAVNTLKRSYPTTEQDQVEQNKLNALVEANRRATDDHALGVRIDAKQDDLTAGSNITISSDGTISTPTIPTDAIAANTAKRSFTTGYQFIVNDASNSATNNTIRVTALEPKVALNTAKRSYTTEEEAKVGRIQDAVVVETAARVRADSVLTAAVALNTAKTVTDNYVDNVTINGQTLRIERTGTLADLTVQLPTTGSSDTAAQLLTKLLTVDGPNSGLDADYLGGHPSSDFIPGTRVGKFIHDNAVIIEDKSTVLVAGVIEIASTGFFNARGGTIIDSVNSSEGGTLTQDNPAIITIRTRPNRIIQIELVGERLAAVGGVTIGSDVFDTVEVLNYPSELVVGLSVSIYDVTVPTTSTLSVPFVSGTSYAGIKLKRRDGTFIGFGDTVVNLGDDIIAKSFETQDLTNLNTVESSKFAYFAGGVPGSPSDDTAGVGLVVDAGDTYHEGHFTMVGGKMFVRDKLNATTFRPWIEVKEKKEFMSANILLDRDQTLTYEHGLGALPTYFYATVTALVDTFLGTLILVAGDTMSEDQLQSNRYTLTANTTHLNLVLGDNLVFFTSSGSRLLYTLDADFAANFTMNLHATL